MSSVGSTFSQLKKRVGQAVADVKEKIKRDDSLDYEFHEDEQLAATYAAYSALGQFVTNFQGLLRDSVLQTQGLCKANSILSSLINEQVHSDISHLFSIQDVADKFAQLQYSISNVYLTNMISSIQNNCKPLVREKEPDFDTRALLDEHKRMYMDIERMQRDNLVPPRQIAQAREQLTAHGQRLRVALANKSKERSQLLHRGILSMICTQHAFFRSITNIYGDLTSQIERDFGKNLRTSATSSNFSSDSSGSSSPASSSPTFAPSATPPRQPSASSPPLAPSSSSSQPSQSLRTNAGSNVPADEIFEPRNRPAPNAGEPKPAAPALPPKPTNNLKEDDLLGLSREPSSSSSSGSAAPPSSSSNGGNTIFNLLEDNGRPPVAKNELLSAFDDDLSVLTPTHSHSSSPWNSSNVPPSGNLMEVNAAPESVTIDGKSVNTGWLHQEEEDGVDKPKKPYVVPKADKSNLQLFKEEEEKKKQEQRTRENVEDVVIQRVEAWAAGRKKNLRSLLSTLQNILWEDSGWTVVGLNDLVEGKKLKLCYMKALRIIHPDKMADKPVEEKFLAERVLDLLQEAAKGQEW